MSRKVIFNVHVGGTYMAEIIASFEDDSMTEDEMIKHLQESLMNAGIKAFLTKIEEVVGKGEKNE